MEPWFPNPRDEIESSAKSYQHGEAEILKAISRYAGTIDYLESVGYIMRCLEWTSSQLECGTRSIKANAETQSHMPDAGP